MAEVQEGGNEKVEDHRDINLSQMYKKMHHQSIHSPRHCRWMCS